MGEKKKAKAKFNSIKLGKFWETAVKMEDWFIFIVFGYTGEVSELDIGLSAVREELSGGRAQCNGFSVEVNSELEMVVDESLFGLPLQIGRRHR